MVSGMRVLLHLHIANSFIYFPLILPLPSGVISAAYYTELNINTAVLRWVNLGNARRIQEIGFGGLVVFLCKSCNGSERLNNLLNVGAPNEHIVDEE